MNLWELQIRSGLPCSPAEVVFLHRSSFTSEVTKQYSLILCQLVLYFLAVLNSKNNHAQENVQLWVHLLSLNTTPLNISGFFIMQTTLFSSNWTEITSLGLMWHTLHNWADNDWTVFNSCWGNLFEIDGSLNNNKFLIHSFMVFHYKGISFSIYLTIAALDHQFCPVILRKAEFIWMTAFTFTNCIIFVWQAFGVGKASLLWEDDRNFTHVW